jgi:hypothetical protein
VTVDERWLLDYYISAKEALISSGYAREIDDVEWLRRDLMSESDFMREAAWVVLCSGFRESIVARAFAAISDAFHRWESADVIVRQGDECVQSARGAFGNDRKLRAIVTIAERVASVGVDCIRSMDDEALLGFCVDLPGIGPITARHLARNVGANVAKPDRHLVRIAGLCGFGDVDVLCSTVSRLSGDRVAVVDAVLWRNAVLSGYQDLREAASSAWN